MVDLFGLIGGLIFSIDVLLQLGDLLPDSFKGLVVELWQALTVATIIRQGIFIEV